MTGPGSGSLGLGRFRWGGLIVSLVMRACVVPSSRARSISIQRATKTERAGETTRSARLYRRSKEGDM